MTRAELVDLLTVERFAPHQPSDRSPPAVEPLPATRGRQRTLDQRTRQRVQQRQRRTTTSERTA